MNQSFYNIAGGIVHKMRREKRTTISEATFRGKREILSKIGIGFISNFLLKVRVLYLTILKRKNLSLPLKVETDQFVICLVLPLSFCQNFLHFTLVSVSIHYGREISEYFSPR